MVKLSKLRLWKRKKKKPIKYSGYSVLQPIYDAILKDLNEQIELGLIKYTYIPERKIYKLDIIDSIGLAIWYVNKFNSPRIKEELEKLKNEFKDLEKEEETNS